MLRARRASHGDRGAVIAEAALLTPFFVTMLFGILEFGGAFRDYLTLTNGVNAGAREESIAGNQTNADQLTLDAIAKATTAFQASEIQKIVVFYANSPDASVPAACLTGPVSQNPLPRGPSTVLCNFYTGSIYPTSGTTTWGSCSLNTDPDRFYCPGGRIAQRVGSSRLHRRLHRDPAPVDHRPVRELAHACRRPP